MWSNGQKYQLLVLLWSRSRGVLWIIEYKIWRYEYSHSKSLNLSLKQLILCKIAGCRLQSYNFTVTCFIVGRIKLYGGRRRGFYSNFKNGGAKTKWPEEFWRFWLKIGVYWFYRGRGQIYFSSWVQFWEVWSTLLFGSLCLMFLEIHFFFFFLILCSMSINFHINKERKSTLYNYSFFENKFLFRW